MIEREVALSTGGAMTDAQEIRGLFASLAPTLVELMTAALQKAADAARRQQGAEAGAPSDPGEGQDDELEMVVSVPQLLMVKSQVLIAAEALKRRGLDVTELAEVLWNWRKK